MAAANPKSPNSQRSVSGLLMSVLRIVFDTRFIGVLAQIVAVVLVVLFFRWVLTNTAANLDDLGSAQFICRDGTSSFRCAFDFLQSDAQFDISETPIEYAPDDSYWLALGVGAANTIKVVSWGIILTTFLGTFVGIARLSNNWLVSNLARWYVDIFRNTPLVLQLVFIFFTFFAFALPSNEEATALFGLPIYATKRGIVYPNIVPLASAGIVAAFAVLGLVQAQLLWSNLGRREERTGKPNNRFIWALIAFIGMFAIGWAVANTRTSDHGIMAHTKLRLREFDSLEPLIKNRFNVNDLIEYEDQRNAWLVIEEQVRLGEYEYNGQMLSPVDLTPELQAEIEESSGVAMITTAEFEENALKLCAIRDDKAALNFTSQLDNAGIPYLMDYESRADKVTDNYAEGEDCEIFVATIARLGAERELLESPSAHIITSIDTPPLIVSIPRLQGLNFVGGGRITSAYAALLLGLVLNTGASVAEIVRAGIQSVSKGQTEAARALGLSESQRLQLVVLPQALQVIIPPQTSQYLNLAKNSTLALAIAYPDFWNVATTTINQSGRSIQIMLIVMGSYLGLSLLISAFLNWYNARITIRER